MVTFPTATRTTEYRYHVDGLPEHLLCRIRKEEQVTRWAYGVDENTGSLVARADLHYDGLSRQIRKHLESEDSDRDYFYSDQWQVLEERVDLGTTRERQFIWNLQGIDDLLRRDTFDEDGDLAASHWALNDGKNVTAVVGTDAAVAERYAYQGFGLPEVLGADFGSPTVPLDQPWETLFCGYRRDEESGLYQVRYRYYHPELGRWLSRDPIRESGGLNFFKYCENNPVARRDVLGLEPSQEQGDKQLQKLAKQLKDLCDKCCDRVCGPKIETEKARAQCKKDAQKIADNVKATWDFNYGSPGSVGGDTVGGYICWEWAKAFEQAIDYVDSIYWDVEQVHFKKEDEVPGEKNYVHFAVRLSACGVQTAECTVYLDDGYLKDQLIHIPPFPDPTCTEITVPDFRVPNPDAYRKPGGPIDGPEAKGAVRPQVVK